MWLQGGLPPQAPRFRTGPAGSTRPTSPRWGPDPLDAVSNLLQQMGNLQLVLSHADTAVKMHLCQQDTLLCQFQLMQAAHAGLLLKLLKSLKLVTLDPSTLPALQASICCLHFSPPSGCDTVHCTTTCSMAWSYPAHLHSACCLAFMCSSSPCADFQACIMPVVSR